MCGICGTYGFADKKLLRTMMDKLHHRGPDGEGSFISKKISLGHKRLSIIDLKTGAQPIFNEERDVVVVFNGEIYNYKELRSVLKKKGHIFKTNADTEVIVHAYEEWGTDSFKKFNGMFAFALFDKKNNELILVRDRIGIKPLYYSKLENKIVFASETKAILEWSELSPSIDYSSMVDYLAFQNMLGDKTLFKEIKMVEPGSYIVCSNLGVSKNYYWDISFDYRKRSESQNVNEFKRVFSESVNRHLISDVKVGAFLSGGFDSSSVVAKAAKNLKDRIPTYTGVFGKSGRYDHETCAHEVSKKVNSRQEDVFVSADDFLKNIKDIVYYLDEPRVGTPAISQYMVSKKIAKDLKVVLTGEGGDEFFAGYPVYKAALLKDKLKENPLSLFGMMNLFKLTEIPRCAYFLVYPFLKPEVSEGLFLIFDAAERKKLFTSDFHKKMGVYSPRSTLQSLTHGKNFSWSENVQYLYIKTYLQGLLVLNDKLAMAHSLESRTPLCDHELVDFSLSVPLSQKLHKKELKFLIKAGMKDELPESIYNQPKKGFSTPFSLWLRGPLKKFTYELLLSDESIKRNIFNKDYVKSLLDKHCNANSDNLFDLVNSHKIWSLINIELWFQTFIDKNKS